MLIPTFYLDTNAIQSLGSTLCHFSNKYVFTSIWVEMELVSSISDDDSFRKKKAALRNLVESGIDVDVLPPPYRMLESFGIATTNWFSVDTWNRFINELLEAKDYDHWQSSCDKEVLKYIKVIDSVDEEFKEAIGKRFASGTAKERKMNFATKFNGSLNDIYKDALGYYVDLFEKKFKVPQYQLISQYDSSQDVFMVVQYYYVEMKAANHDAPARNDFNDLLHLHYIKNNCYLVTDDKGFAKCVNDVLKGHAITVNEFKAIIVNSKLNKSEINKPL